MSRPDLETGLMRSWQAFDVTPQMATDGESTSSIYLLYHKSFYTNILFLLSLLHVIIEYPLTQARFHSSGGSSI